MVRIRGPFPRPDNNVAVAGSRGTHSDQPTRNAEESNGSSPLRQRLRMTENENAPADISHLPPRNGTTPTTSRTVPTSGLSTAPNTSLSSDPSAAPPPSTGLAKSHFTNSNKITKRRRAVPVKGTKADRLREYLKYFPKR
ncbi:hypothetical protein QBC32DRAFT_177537, partial [Pseudoneurospora amorphoporcata]